MVCYGDDRMDNRQNVTYHLQCVKLKENRNSLWEQKSGPFSPRLHFQQYQEMLCKKQMSPASLCSLSYSPVTVIIGLGILGDTSLPDPFLYLWMDLLRVNLHTTDITTYH